MKEKIEIIRTTRACKVLEQKVYAERLENGSWEIKNVKEGWTIPADKLFHPMSRYFEKPTLWRYWICNRNVRKWKTRTLELLDRSKINKVVDEGFGVFLRMNNTSYYFQYREEDYKKLKEFILGVQKMKTKAKTGGK